MVGVPGRSKACHTCKKRRKGCDAQRPACGQCLRHGVVCDGYDRKRIFINSNAEVEQRKATRPLIAHAQQRHPNTHALSSPTTCGTLNKTACEWQYVDVFWQAYLPYSCAVSPLAARYSTTGWTAVAQRLYHDHDLLKLALGAFSFCTVGHRAKDDWMMVKGRRLYGMALRKMAQALRSSEADATYDNVIIIASRILSLFEGFFETHQDDRLAQHKVWFHHSAGEAALFLRRGPAAYATGDAHCLLVDGRLHMATLDMVTRKRSFLSSPEWRTIPWRGSEKSPKDTLFDIFVDIPELLEGLDTLYDLDGHEKIHSDLCGSFLEKLMGYETKLQRWYEYTSQSVPWLCDNALLLHNEVGLAAVHLMTLYWTVRALLFNTRQLPMFHPKGHVDDTGRKEMQAQIMPLLERLTDEQSGWFGRQAAVLPGGAMYCLIKGSSQETEKKLEMEKLHMLFGDIQSTTISPTFMGCKA